jgi:hypothetical protein
MSFGPSMDRPTRKRCSFRKRTQSSSSSVPLVCRSFSIRCPGFACFFCSATILGKKSRPISVGSPPCQEKTTSSPVTLPM